MLSLLSYGNDQTYFEEIKQFYYRDEFSHQVQEWNRQRTMAIERALQQFLYVQMAKELKNKLLAEAKEYVIKVKMETHDLYLYDFPRLELRVMRPLNSSPVASVETLRAGGA